MKQHLTTFAWLLSTTVLILAVVAWLDCLLIPLEKVNVYDIFPLFGIIAFSLMWVHYMIGAAWKLFDYDRSKLNNYYRYTSYGVLAAILLHPGLVTWQMWKDNLGLPYNYVAPQLKLYVVLGTIAWITFMLFELHRFLADRPWWKYIAKLSDVGMILILIHGYKLGCAIMPGWWNIVWIFYGITLIAAILYGYVSPPKETSS